MTCNVTREIHTRQYCTILLLSIVILYSNAVRKTSGKSSKNCTRFTKA